MKWHAYTFEYTEAEQRAFEELRMRYQQGHDLWNPNELAHLQFVRWLVQSGRLTVDGDPLAEGDTAWRTGMVFSPRPRSAL